LSTERDTQREEKRREEKRRDRQTKEKWAGVGVIWFCNVLPFSFSLSLACVEFLLKI
jgi:hypothetical protein